MNCHVCGTGFDEIPATARFMLNDGSDKPVCGICGFLRLMEGDIAETAKARWKAWRESRT